MRTTHWGHLTALVPDLVHRRILDLGSGKGAFLVQAAQAGAFVAGLEYSATYRDITNHALGAAGLNVPVVAGRAEELPFPDASFDFINICEVFEHVDDPLRMLREVYRTLAPGGLVYMSVPNRFAVRDPHYHLWFVNWLPRMFANTFISLFNRHKNYEDKSAGLQELKDMHYSTYRAVVRSCEIRGFAVSDIRLIRIRERVPGLLYPFAWAAYVALRTVYFDSFHLLLGKK